MSGKPATPEPLETALSRAGDQLMADRWMPPQAGVVPRVRVGQRWISVLWALPVAAAFTDCRLRISGLIEVPQDLSLADLKAMPKQAQITDHFCIQGWSGVAEWAGAPMRDILDLVRPLPEARYAVFYSLAEGADGGRYYDVRDLANMRHDLTLLAYEMNGEPLNILHGAPLRLRCENQLGYKMVKWIAAIEFVSGFAHLGAGQGGYNEDHEFYG